MMWKKRLKQALKGQVLKKHPMFKDLNARRAPHTKIDSCNIVSSKWKFVYCRTPKLANSTVMATLVHADTGFRAITRDDMKRVKSSYSTIGSTKLNKIANAEYFKFAVVRHPFERIISAFNDKIIDVSGYQEEVRG